MIGVRPDVDPRAELPGLVQILHETHQRIQALTGGMIDAVLDAGSGATYLLPNSQAHLRSSESEQRRFAFEKSGILDALPAHIALLDRTGRVVSVNEAWRDFGAANALTSEAFAVGQSYLAVCDRARGSGTEEACAAAAGIRAVLAGRAPNFSMEYSCDSPIRQRWFRLIVAPHRDAEVGGAVSMHIDISERKRAEEERNRLFNLSEDLLIVGNLAGTFEQVNPACTRCLGWSAEELTSNPWLDFVPLEDHAATIRAAEQLTAGTVIRDFENRYRCKDGTYRWLSWNVHPLLESGQLFCVARDVTDRKLAAQRLADQAALLDVAQDAIVVWGIDGRILFWNRSAERMYGWTATAALGLVRVKMRWDDATAFDRALQATIERGYWTGRLEVPCKDGGTQTVGANWTLVRGADGEARSILAVETDISERLGLEEQLRQSQRLDAVGQLTGGIAHDFNNLLTVILGNAELLVEDLPAGDRRKTLASMTLAAAQSGAELTNRLLAFSRRQALNPVVTDINSLLTGFEGLLRRTLSESIAIELTAGSGLWNALVDPAELENAVLNLCINARDAMKSGGRLTIETSNVRLDRGYAENHAEVTPGQYVMIAVSDNGTGIPPEIVGRVFDPFFTTKELGKGTGLGLSMVYGFIKQTGGHVAVYSEVGHGTTIKLYLPRGTDPVAMPAAEIQEMAEPNGGSETILMVEDNDLVRKHVEDQLRTLGYDVLVASNASAAMEIFGDGSTIDLLFTDVIMAGGMNGKELADAARRIRPDLKVLFTSGYAENAIVHQGRLDPGVFLLSKPYRHAELASMIRSALLPC